MINNTIETAQTQAQEFNEIISNSKKEADSALTAIRITAAEKGVSQQSSYFQTAAAGHDASARTWLRVVVILSFVLLLFSFISLFSAMMLTFSNPYQIVQISLAKIFIFGILAYSIVASVRNYSANRHNAAVNRHRQNSLQSFNALVEASGSQDKRDIILSYAASSIFAPQDTGFIKDVSAPNLPVTQLIEAVVPKAT